MLNPLLFRFLTVCSLRWLGLLDTTQRRLVRGERGAANRVDRHCLSATSIESLRSVRLRYTSFIGCAVWRTGKQALGDLL